ncbi:septum formation family protein [Agreia sp. PsM10]|uniref:septum formation family protein n=1 Tax=Agreia sp. PsM10 TaxID=3030533 RepID=UPI00263BC6AF|nr:septum formation family protein [Agreia sp. PsM10]MDN4641452.1 septum formation family protein [Agreia sp. PsM10]
MTSAPLTRTLITGLAATLSAAALLTGCSAISDLVPQNATRDGETGVVTEAGDTSVFTLREGDCINDVAEMVSDVPTVPCDQLHDWEVYRNVTMTDTDFPGDEAIAAFADEQCNAEFGTFIGVAYESSVYENNYYVPNADSWEQLGDRIVSCLVGDPAGQVTGSLRGIGA